MRLQKFLSRAGVASRRHAEALITAGRVRVNGTVVTELGTRVLAGQDAVEVDGKAVAVGRPVWVLLNKPKGYVSTRDDPQGRPTVYDLLPAEFGSLFYVGRLDVDTEGLLLLTNQGDVANRIAHPRYQVDRVYDATVQGIPSAETLEELHRGVMLEDGLARAHAVRRLGVLGPHASRLALTIREGRKREVRRLLEAVGHPIHRLVRIRFGPIRLGATKPGTWRRLTDAEVANLARQR
jgi:23S rRNA pseudouridine2605 synthase